MAISFVGAAEADFSAGTPTSATANMPAGIAVDDVMILAVTENKVPIVLTDPGDSWVRIEASQIEETALTGLYYWKRATVSGGGTAPTVSSDTGGGWRLDVAVYRGVDTTNPFIDHGAQIEASSTTSHSAPALTNTDTGAWGVFSGAFRQVATPASWTPGAGLTERLDADIGASNTTNIAQTWADTNGTQTTGSKTYSATGSASSPQAIMWAGLLKPASTGTAVTAVTATATATAPAPSVTATSTVTAVASTATAGSPAPTVTANSTITAVVAAATAAAPVPALAADQNLTSPVATVTADAPAPTVLTGVIVIAVEATATTNAPAPAYTATGLVTAPEATVTATAPAPLLAADAAVATDVATVTAVALAPSVFSPVRFSFWTGTNWEAVVPLVWDGSTWLDDVRLTITPS